MEIKRDHYLNLLRVRKENGFVKIITGIRRAGKSYLLNHIFYNDLLNEGVNEDHIIRFAFDSASDLKLIHEDLNELTLQNKKVDPNKFLDYINQKLIDKKMYYLLLDEVQNLNNFEIVLNSYLKEENIDIYVTGSNSRFLSKDVLTEFEGRGDEIHVYPLSFQEFSSCYQEDKTYMLEDYLLYGGLPLVVLAKTEEQKISYLKTQIQNVYLRDIIHRYQLDKDNNISELFHVLASDMATLISPNKLSNTFKSLKNVNFSSNEINQYISYMEDAFLLSKVERYDIKGKKHISSPYKIFFEDVGLRNASLNFKQIEDPHLMENIIYNELRFRGYNVDIGIVEIREKENEKTLKKQLEIDFVANKGSKRYYIQSCFSIGDANKLAQETRPFDKTRDSFKKIIVVGNDIRLRRDEKGYVMMGIKEFLLNPNSLDL